MWNFYNSSKVWINTSYGKDKKNSTFSTTANARTFSFIDIVTLIENRVGPLLKTGIPIHREV